jgi:hypothetical protein
MTDETRSHADALELSEDAAHRLLARAVELDAARGPTLTVAQLREVAREAGISAAAFDAAVRELGEGPHAPPRAAPWRTPPWRTPPWRALGHALARGALAVGGGLGLISVASRVTNAAGADWPVHHGAVIAANVLAVLLARRLGARAVAVLFAVLAAAQAGEYPMRLLFGRDAVQGGPTKWALVLASLLGIGFGALLRHRRRAAGPGGSALPALPAPPAPARDAAPAPAPPTRPRPGTLRLRHA